MDKRNRWTFKPTTRGIAAPTTVSGAMRLAIADGRALLEDAGRYLFYYGTWYSNTDGICVVCAAGAVMARHFNVGGETVVPSDFDDAWARVLGCIDAVREEQFGRAYEMMTPGVLDAHMFADEVNAALADDPACANGEFTDNVAYAKFLDRLETAVLPAIEDAESAAARTAGPPARNTGAAAEPSSLKRLRPPGSASLQATGAQA